MKNKIEVDREVLENALELTNKIINILNKVPRFLYRPSKKDSENLLRHKQDLIKSLK